MSHQEGIAKKVLLSAKKECTKGQNASLLYRKATKLLTPIRNSSVYDFGAFLSIHYTTLGLKIQRKNNPALRL